MKFFFQKRFNMMDLIWCGFTGTLLQQGRPLSAILCVVLGVLISLTGETILESKRGSDRDPYDF